MSDSPYARRIYSISNLSGYVIKKSDEKLKSKPVYQATLSRLSKMSHTNSRNQQWGIESIQPNK